MGLYLIFAATPWYFNPGTYQAILTVACGLGFVIFVHELGHFLVAKACGVKCEKFYIGFDIPIWKFPRALCKFQWGETEYGIGIVPLGGYVKMLGQHDDPREAEAEAERIKVHAGGQEQLDPRSYPAQPVWERMAIISAGVVMNLIFAVIFAAIAFRSGVPYETCIIGATSPGDPAWVANIQPGDKIVRIGKNGTYSEHLRYDKDLVTSVILNGPDVPLPLLIRRGDTEKELSLTPSRRRLSRQTNRVTLGVMPMMTLDVRDMDEVDEVIFERYPNWSEFKTGDRITEVNGSPLKSYPELNAFVANHPAEDLLFSVERTERATPKNEAPKKYNVSVTIPAERTHWLGFSVKMGAVVGVQQNSPASSADGFKEGDILVSVAGQPAGDPLTLPQRMLKYVGKETEFAVQRKGNDGQFHENKITLVPRPPTAPNLEYEFNSAVGLDSIGIAYHVENEIDWVSPESPAAQAGLQPGDQIEKVQFIAANKEREQEEKKFDRSFGKEIELFRNESDWPMVHSRCQVVLPDTVVKIWYQRGETHATAQVAAVISEYYNDSRSVPVTVVHDTHQTKYWSEAWFLGFRETKEQLFGVVAVLHRLVTGRISPKNLVGPAGIAAVAGSEASRGLPRFLIFLTFLSANLAVINFLPVPALDGGHLMFLAWEGIVRRPVNVAVQGWLTLFGIACLLGLMVFVFGLDFKRFFP